MLNEIIKGIALALNTAFGDDAEVYVNDVEQGLEAGSFFVNVLQPDLAPLLGGRGLKTNPFVIQYFPKTGKTHTECYTVAETLINALMFITLPNGDILHGTRMRYEVVDDVLQFYVNYNHTRLTTPDETYMETLELETGTQKG